VTTAVDKGEAGTPVVASGELRRGPDRRRRPTPMFSRYTFCGGRRRAARRTDEREGSFVDRHGLGVLLVVLGIVGLNLADAWFTLYFLSCGGQELNPAVQTVLDLAGHPYPFLVLKTLGIGLLCAFLAITKNFRSARVGIAIVLVGYTVLLGWHLYLLGMLGLAS
jgi:hypothetical protein